MAARTADPLVALVDEFNAILKRLTLDLEGRFPEDAAIARAKKRIFLAIDAAPTVIIRDVGPYLFAYKEKIYAADDAFFIDNSYDKELSEGTNAGKVSLAEHIIPKVKQLWKGAPKDERDQYAATVQGLLDIYVDYELELKLAARGAQ